MTFLPAPVNTGLRFRRSDLAGKPEIPAIVDLVVEVSRGTTLSKGEAKVHTVEHVLAACVGLQIDNLIIELDNIEPPICDGSAQPFVEALLKAEGGLPVNVKFFFEGQEEIGSPQLKTFVEENKNIVFLDLQKR